MNVVADKMGIDIHEVIRTAATKPFGFVAYTPGPGLGGHGILIGKAIKASKILVLGLAYEKNVDDVRESPAGHAKLLVDTRGRYQKAASNVIRA